MTTTQKLIDQQIRYNTVRVTKDGNNLGIMPIREAQNIAYDNGLNLVLMSDKSKPPICTIMDYTKYLYDQKKSKKKAHVIEQKEIRLRPVTEDNDLQIKMKQARSFLDNGKHVQIKVKFKRRELQHREQGRSIINKVIEILKDISTVTKPPKFEGECFLVQLIPNKK